jgi:hypothetical protein
MLEVSISAMLILSLDTRTAAILRIIETLIGAGTGMLGGLVFAPLRVQLAEEAVDELSRHLSGLFEQMATDIVTGRDEGAAEDRLYRARQVVGEIQKVDQALAKAAESLRLNPRGRSLAHASVALRDGLETLEHAAVTVRGSLARSLMPCWLGEARSATPRSASACHRHCGSWQARSATSVVSSGPTSLPTVPPRRSVSGSRLTSCSGQLKLVSTRRRSPSSCGTSPGYVAAGGRGALSCSPTSAACPTSCRWNTASGRGSGGRDLMLAGRREYGAPRFAAGAGRDDRGHGQRTGTSRPEDAKTCPSREGFNSQPPSGDGR